MELYALTSVGGGRCETSPTHVRITEEARREGRSLDEIANEAIKRYLTLRRRQALQQYGQSRADELGITEGDVSRLISNCRAEERSR